MRTLLLIGYSAAELGIFRDSDPKIAVIQAAIRERLLAYLDEGLEWLIFTGSLGFEYWALQVAQKLRKDYPQLQLATLFDFETHGAQWNEANRAKLEAFKQVDFVKYSFPSYENPQQFRAYNTFLADNTDGAWIFYDAEHETRLHYFVDYLKNLPDYDLDLLDFESLQELADELMNDE